MFTQFWCSVVILCGLLLQFATVLDGKKFSFPQVSSFGSSVKREREFFARPLQFVAVKKDSDGSENFDLDEDEEDYDSKQKKNENTSASFQVMITKRMRNTLINELGYLPSEVDNMEPQIAAVVIERNLRRPRKGMPASWRKNAEDREGNNFLIQCRDTLGNLFRGILDLTNNYLRPVLPVVIVSSLLYFQRHSIMFVVSSLMSSMKSFSSKWSSKRYDIEEEEEESYSSRRQNRGAGGGLFGWKRPGPSPRNRKISDEQHSQSEDPAAAVHSRLKDSHVREEFDEEKINLKAYDKVLSPSWWDQFSFTNQKK